MHHDLPSLHAITRRQFLGAGSLGLGALALGELGLAAPLLDGQIDPAAVRSPHFPGRAKSVIYVHLAGSPSQLELYDHKPELARLHGTPCPDEYLKGERFAFIKGHPELLRPLHGFSKRGQSGMELGDLLPQLGGVADELCLVRSMHTSQFNHAPAQLLLHTGEPRFGSPSMGSWVTYGLGCENSNLPAFVVLVSGQTPDAGKSIWGSGYLPGIFQGVQCRTSGDPVLFLKDPKGVDRAGRAAVIASVNDLNRITAERSGDPETATRIAQYELAHRMQLAAPEAMDLLREDAATLELYGSQPGVSSFANNCLLARRLVERGVRYVQLFDWGWDGHGTNASDDLLHQLPTKCGQADRPLAALITDLRRRGLLDQTLIVCGGEFGRTPVAEFRDGKRDFLGRDHHPHAFSIWMAGGGTRRGIVHGATDDLGYRITRDPVSVRDLQATILHLLGFDHKRLTYRHNGLDHRLTGVQESARVVREILV
ncbi:MAG: DUF1501 domain-containing protein [Planctomycetes bacterium]|nr:DUF1501 domain-containing protein [Planctomycetota bacterium]